MDVIWVEIQQRTLAAQRSRYVNVITAKRRKDLGCPDGVMTVVFAPLDGKISSLPQRAAQGTSFNSLSIYY